MKKTIWKFELQVVNHQTINMPKNARVLSAQVQPETGLCCWAIVDPDAPKVRRAFAVLGTGLNASAASDPLLANFVGTFQIANGALVGHVFDLGEV